MQINYLDPHLVMCCSSPYSCFNPQKRKNCYLKSTNNKNNLKKNKQKKRLYSTHCVYTTINMHPLMIKKVEGNISLIIIIMIQRHESNKYTQILCREKPATFLFSKFICIHTVTHTYTFSIYKCVCVLNLVRW